VTLAAKVLTVSDGVVAGTREDRSGQQLVERLLSAGYEVVDRRTVAAEYHREPPATLGIDPPTEHAERHGERLLVGACQRPPAVPQQHEALAIAGVDVGERVPERVEAVAEVGQV